MPRGGARPGAGRKKKERPEAKGQWGGARAKGERSKVDTLSAEDLDWSFMADEKAMETLRKAAKATERRDELATRDDFEQEGLMWLASRGERVNKWLARGDYTSLGMQLTYYLKERAMYAEAHHEYEVEDLDTYGMRTGEIEWGE